MITTVLPNYNPSNSLSIYRLMVKGPIVPLHGSFLKLRKAPNVDHNYYVTRLCLETKFVSSS
jgi:hypothetical protein